MSSTEDAMDKWFGNFPSKRFADDTCYLIGAWANVSVIKTNEGLVLFDLSNRIFHRRIFNKIRKFSDKQIRYIIYSHGHFDHCFGYASIFKEIKNKGWEMPHIIAHENILNRFEKYKELDRYHSWINNQQFSSLWNIPKEGVSAHDTLDPTIIIHGNKNYEFKLGNYFFEIYHDKGETDDSLWMFFPEKEVLFPGELVSNPTFPNVGNPFKVQRYPKQWALAMERMLEKDAKYLAPGHGPLIEGKKNVQEALSIRAEVIHFVYDEVVKRLNEGKWFEQIYHEMLDIYPEKFKMHKYLTPSYGCYRFAIHAVYRLFHGWYITGNPTDLFPAKSNEIAEEFLAINNEKKYLSHAEKLYRQGKLQLALHILDIIIKGSSSNNKTSLLGAYSLKSRILKQKQAEESSFIAKNILRNGIHELESKIEKLKNL
ncbi:MAG: alkyl sulfatase dimerization domain-containing protein [Candidatus Hodarchaeota archaeon]